MYTRFFTRCARACANMLAHTFEDIGYLRVLDTTEEPLIDPRRRVAGPASSRCWSPCRLSSKTIPKGHHELCDLRCFVSSIIVVGQEIVGQATACYFPRRFVCYLCFLEPFFSAGLHVCSTGEQGAASKSMFHHQNCSHPQGRACRQPGRPR